MMKALLLLIVNHFLIGELMETKFMHLFVRPCKGFSLKISYNLRLNVNPEICEDSPKLVRS